MNQLKTGAKDILRVSPRIILIAGILVYLVSNQLIALRFSGYFLLAEGLSAILKKLVRCTLPDQSFIYRPRGGGDCHGCGVFREFSKGCIQVHTRTGMPSGHSLTAAMTTAFWCLWIWYNGSGSIVNKFMRMSLLIILALLVMISRSPIVEGCHTYPQILVGGVIGGLLGAGLFYFDQKMFNKKSVM